MNDNIYVFVLCYVFLELRRLKLFVISWKHMLVVNLQVGETPLLDHVFNVNDGWCLKIFVFGIDLMKYNDYG